MADKFMYIPNDDTQNYTVGYNYWLNLLETQLNQPTNHNSIKIPKVVKLTKRKRYYKTLSPPSL